jgi:hypothetical protein
VPPHPTISPRAASSIASRRLTIIASLLMF